MSSASEPASRWKKLLWQCLPWLPALITLGLINALRVGVPHNDSWWFVQAYMDWQQGHYGWKDLFATHGAHPYVPGKLIYWFALHVTEGDVSWLPVMSWVFSVGVALGFRALLKVQLEDSKKAQLWLQFLANTLIFTAAQGGTWLWDFLYANFIPGMCLVGALACLAREGITMGRLLAMDGFVVLAAFSFGSGFTLAWLMLPLLWWRLREQKRSMIWLAGAVALALVLTWLAMVYLPSLSTTKVNADAAGRVDGAVSRPWMTFSYLLVLIGASLGHGTAIDPVDQSMTLGVLALTALLVCMVQLWRQRHDVKLLADAWPWIACCGFTVLNGLLIVLARMNSSYATALFPRYQTFTLFFLLGVMMLIVLLARRGHLKLSALTVPVITAFLALQAVNWAYGVQDMRRYHQFLKQDRAALAFAKILPLDPDRVIQHAGRGSVARVAIPWHDQGHLRRVTMLEDSRLSQLRRSSDMSSGTSHLDYAGRNARGQVFVQGVCAGSKDFGELPELVLVTAALPGQEERIVGFQFPFLPEDYFFDRIRQRDREDYYRGFRVVLDQVPLPANPGIKLRAYAYFEGRRTIRRIPGEFALP